MSVAAAGVTAIMRRVPPSEMPRFVLLMDPPETLRVDSKEFACDGGGGVHGHPRVFLHIGADGNTDCPYCGRHFVLGDGATDEGR